MIKCYFDGKMKDCNISDCNTCKINESNNLEQETNIDMDLRDILERLNEIEVSNLSYERKIELYIFLRKNIENQIC